MTDSGINVPKPLKKITYTYMANLFARNTPEAYNELKNLIKERGPNITFSNGVPCVYELLQYIEIGDQTFNTKEKLRKHAIEDISHAIKILHLFLDDDRLETKTINYSNIDTYGKNAINTVIENYINYIKVFKEIPPSFFTDSILLLLKKGSDPFIRDMDKNSAYDYLTQTIHIANLVEPPKEYESIPTESLTLLLEECKKFYEEEYGTPLPVIDTKHVTTTNTNNPKSLNTNKKSRKTNKKVIRGGTRYRKYKK